MPPQPQIIPITSLDDSALQPYRTLRRPMEHLHAGIFVAEGARVVRRMLECGFPPVSLLLTDDWYRELFLGDKPISVPDGLPVYTGSKSLLESIVGFNLHQGIMAIGRVPAEPSLEDLVVGIPSPRLIVAMDGLVNSENIGVVIRNCAALGAGGVIAGETSGSPWLRRAVRNSMGAVFRMPVVHSADLRDTLARLSKDYGIATIGTDPHSEATLYGTDLRGDCCLVMGNEGEGIRKSVLEVCTHRVSIPMMNNTDSLNVASASAVFLSEVLRQRLKI